MGQGNSSSSKKLYDIKRETLPHSCHKYVLCNKASVRPPPHHYGLILTLGLAEGTTGNVVFKVSVLWDLPLLLLGTPLLSCEQAQVS